MDQDQAPLLAARNGYHRLDRYGSIPPDPLTVSPGVDTVGGAHGIASGQVAADAPPPTPSYGPGAWWRGPADGHR